jgi:hypothetical protein
MTVPATHDVHVTVRRLSMDAACAGTHDIGTADFPARLESALTERLGEQAGEGRIRRPDESVTEKIATAVASHVQPLMGPRNG